MGIISRAEWGARHPDGFSAAPVPWSENWLHHSVTAQLSPNATFAEECAQMRVIEDIGQNNFGGGISYTRLIFPSGRIYQGHSVNRQGAHTLGRNDRARAICYVGNYEVHQLTEAQKRSAAWVLWDDARQGRCQARLNGGHRDVYSTACPGRHAYAAIPEINRLAASGDLEDDMALTPDDGNVKWAVKDPYNKGRVETQTVADWVGLAAIHGGHNGLKLDALTAKVDALAGALSDDEAKILAAVRAQPTGGQVDVVQLAAQLRESLGGALADELAQRLGGA